MFCPLRQPREVEQTKCGVGQWLDRDGGMPVLQPRLTSAAVAVLAAWHFPTPRVAFAKSGRVAVWLFRGMSCLGVPRQPVFCISS